MKRAFLLAAAAAILGGCATVNVNRDDRTMVVIENTGWYLFNFIPIASGNPDHPNRFSSRWFSNVVTLKNNMKMLNAVMTDEGATQVKDLTSYTTDEKVFVILLARHTYHTSAELIIPDDDAEPGASTETTKEASNADR